MMKRFIIHSSETFTSIKSSMIYPLSLNKVIKDSYHHVILLNLYEDNGYWNRLVLKIEMN
jgi:hypothetical protein